MGLEQGFTLAEPLGREKGQPLTIELAMAGDMLATLDPDGTALNVMGKDGQVVLRYTGLKTYDSDGRELRSRMEVRGERLLLRVEDEGARYPVVIDPLVQLAELVASDGAANDQFGYSVAVSGGTAIVGAPNHKVGSNVQQGAVYVFSQSGGTWTQQAELTALDGAAYDLFGVSVALSGNTVVVGAGGKTIGANPDQGAAYVFVQNGGTWTQQAELIASDGAAYDWFGLSVSVDGSVALVGAYNKTIGLNSGQGAAYVFDQNGESWTQQAELTASDGQSFDQFGASVAVSGTTGMVGSPLHSVGEQLLMGVAYVFVQRGETWGQQAELTARDGAAYDFFGAAVALDGSTSVIGAYDKTIASHYSQGAAYVFVQSGETWSQQGELTASDGAAYDQFGVAVSVSGSSAVIGANQHNVNSNLKQGAAYVFAQSGSSWSQQQEVTASDGAPGDQFGVAVSVSGNSVLVGANTKTVGSNSSQGATYIFATPVPAQITSPPKGSTLQGSSATFVWTAETGATNYQLWVGSAPGTHNIASIDTNGLTITVNNLPIDGSVIYVTLYGYAANTWTLQDSAEYTAVTIVKAVITSPPKNSTLTGTAAAFTWTAETGATSYQLWVGSSAGAHDIASLVTRGLGATINNLPTDGSQLYVTLYGYVSGWLVQDTAQYTAVTIVKAVITSPPKNSTLSGSSVPFIWTAETGATSYQLWVGSTPGTHDIASMTTSGLLATVNNMPTDGSQIYVTLYGYVGGWTVQDTAQYTAANLATAQITSPPKGSTLPGSRVMFTWSAEGGGTQYQLWVGNTPGSHDIAAVSTTGLTATVSGLPTDGRTLYVTLYGYAGRWTVQDTAQYTAANFAMAQIASPPKGSTLPGSAVTFTWSAEGGATSYQLWVGSTPGGHDIAASTTSNLSVNIAGIPTDGRAIYVSLYGYASTWTLQDTAQYTAASQ